MVRPVRSHSSKRLARSWSEWNWPILSPYSWVCGNLAGEFQYGTFSVFVNAAVVVIWKFPLTFPQQAAALAIVHLFVLAMGGYGLYVWGSYVVAAVAIAIEIAAARARLSAARRTQTGEKEHR